MARALTKNSTNLYSPYKILVGPLEVKKKMSSSQLTLFNTVPAGAIDTLYDEGLQPRFKHANLERFLGVCDITRNFRDLDEETTKRQ